MKILVISDTHRNTAAIRNVLKAVKSSVAMVFHLGDCRDDIKPFEKENPQLRFVCVSGNCDFNTDVPLNIVVPVRGKKIWLCHGHQDNVKMTYDRISYRAEELGVDACLFGHTHSPVLFYQSGILFLNPGSLSSPRGYAVPTYGMLDVSDEGAITPSLVGVYGKGFFRPIDW